MRAIPITALLLGGKLGKRFTGHDEAIVGPQIQPRILHVQGHGEVLSGQQDVRSTAYCREKMRQMTRFAFKSTYIYS